MAERRTERPTARKLARAREQGRVPRSPELQAAGALLAAGAVLAAGGGAWIDALRRLVRSGLTAAAQPSPAAHALAALVAPLRELALHTALGLAAVALAAWMAGFVQVGPLLSVAAVSPDLRRLSPAERLRALGTSERLEELAVSALKLAVILAAAAAVIAPSVRGMLALPLGAVQRAGSALAALLVDLALRMGAVLALLGVFDLILRRLRHAREQRMTRRELEDEWRETHGQPEPRRARRRLHAELAAQAAVAGLADAAVLLLDARGRAVALAFDADDPAQHAPRLVAKGMGSAAVRMQAWAAQRDLPVRWEGALVAALYPLELTQAVPPAHYAAVAALFAALPGHRP